MKHLAIAGAALALAAASSGALAGASSMGEIIKIRGGKIHEVEAVGYAMPYGARSGWNHYGQ